MSKYLGVDGLPRPKEEDEQISQNFESLFKTPTGKAVLSYLRSVTIEMIAGPNVSNEEIRHREGQRFLVAIIEKRIKHSQRIKDNG